MTYLFLNSTHPLPNPSSYQPLSTPLPNPSSYQPLSPPLPNPSSYQPLSPPLPNPPYKPLSTPLPNPSSNQPLSPPLPNPSSYQLLSPPLPNFSSYQQLSPQLPSFYQERELTGRLLLLLSWIFLMTLLIAASGSTRKFILNANVQDVPIFLTGIQCAEHCNSVFSIDTACMLMFPCWLILYGGK